MHIESCSIGGVGSTKSCGSVFVFGCVVVVVFGLGVICSVGVRRIKSLGGLISGVSKVES